MLKNILTALKKLVIALSILLAGVVSVAWMLAGFVALALLPSISATVGAVYSPLTQLVYEIGFVVTVILGMIVPVALIAKYTA